MAALTSILPQPRRPQPVMEELPEVSTPAPAPSRREPPPYRHRQDFIPRTVEDFGDGGAFPEIHVAQYPLDMGRKTKTSSAVVPVVVDQDGKTRFDSIVTQNAGGKIVYSRYKDLIPVQYKDEDLARPGPEEEKEVTEKTRAALEKLVGQKIKATQPASAVKEAAGPTFVRYTPASQGGANSGPTTRIIRMVEVASDPMEPPKFKRKKAVRGPPSPPVPLMRSPPRKVTMKDQQEWKIPPCISNWKNAKGYTIPLDKRLAADGRGLQEVTINEKFGKLYEALVIAERNAREEVEKRNQIQQKLALREREKKEELLSELAKKARAQREALTELEAKTLPKLDSKLEEGRFKRESIREDRRRDRERERRLESLGRKTSKASRDADRDVSERIALGMKAPPVTAETMYDQRLFNQSAGMDSGFAHDDTYNVYDKPLFQGSSASAVYRPKKESDPFGDEEAPSGGAAPVTAELNTAKFKPDKDFSGVDRSQKSEARSRPVEFEKAAEDPFGLDAFLSNAKATASNKRPLDKIGQGSLHAGAAGGVGGGEGGSKRRGIEFDSSKDDKDRRRK